MIEHENGLKTPKGFVIANKKPNLFERMVEYAEKGALRGKWLGFPTFHEYYTMSLPGVTDWTGAPKSGKTQVLMELLLNTSEFYGWKHLVYFPDIGDADEIIADLIHKRSGKTFDKRYRNHITEFEISVHLQWILHHFIILTKEDLKARLSPIDFWDYAVELKKAREGDLHTASIDSWKDVYFYEPGLRTDIRMYEILSYRNALAEKHKMHFHTIIHPLRTEKDKDGKRKPPTPYDYKEGTAWFDNGKNMITVHRPDLSENEVEIYVNKVKPRSVGNEGMFKMYFDVVKFRYYELDLNERRYAQKDEYKLEKIEVDTGVSGDDDDTDIPF